MSSFGSGSTTTAGASITLRNFTGTDGNQAGTDGLVPGPGIAQAGYVLGAEGDWVLTVKAIADLNESSTRIATTNFVQTLIGQAQLGGGNANLSALGDVSFANLATGQFLQYNPNADNNWSNITLTLGIIDDVDLAGLVDGNALVYSAAANNGNGGWVPGEGGGGGAATLNGLGDVTIAGGADKHFLVRNNAGQYVNRLISSADLSNSADLILRDGTVAFTGDVDIIDHDLSVGTITIKDNVNTFLIQSEDGANYIRINTTNNSEGIVFEKDTAFNTRVDFNNTVVVNEAGNGIDFRVETGTETHAIFTDGGNDRVGIFQNNPTVPLDIVGDTKITGDVEITGTLTSSDLLEKARDASGTALENGVHTGIAFTNDDANDRINATVDITGFSVRDLSDVSNDALANGKILKVVGGVLTQVDETDTNTQLSDEQVQDIVGDMVDGGTETDITVSYDDGAGKLNFVVDNTIARLDDPDFTGTPTAPTAGAGTNTTQIATTAFVQTELSTIENLGDVTINNIQDGQVLIWDEDAGGQGVGRLVPGDSEGKSQEEIEDIVGGMIGATTDITVTYNDNGAGVGNISYSVDNTIARVNNPDLTGTPTAPTAAHDTNTTQLATTEFVLSQIAGTDINILESVNTANKAEGKILKYDGNGVLVVSDDEGKTQEEIEDIVGGMVVGNTETGITVTYQAGDNTLDFEVDNTTVGFLGGVQTFTGDKTFTGAVDLTGATATGATQNASDNSTSLATTAYVDAQIDTDITALDLANNYQGKNARLDDIAALGVVNNNFIVGNGNNLVLETPTQAITSLGMGVGNNDLLIGTGANTFGTIATTDGSRAFLASDGSLNGLDGVVIAGNIGAGNDGESLRWDGANLEWKNTKLAFGDLNQNVASTQNVALLNQEQTFSNNITFTADVDLTGAVVTATTQQNADDSTKVATTAFVKNVVEAVGNVSDLGDLADVTLGADNGNGVAEAVGQVVRISAVDNDGNATYRNTQLAYSDLSGTPTIGQDVQAYNATLQGISALQPVSASRFLYTTGEDTFGEGTISQVGLDILADANPGEVRGTISAQESNDTLTALAGLNTGVKQLIYSNTADDDLEMTGLSDLGKTFIASSVGVNDLSDVLVANVANAQILVYDGDQVGQNNNQWKNVALSGDVAITNAGVATIQDDAITLAKIDIISDDAITNAKLANEYVTFSDGANADNLSLGQTVSFNAVADETTVEVAADAGAGVSITIGLPDDVTIAQDLTVTRNLIVNGTTTTLNTATLDVEDTIIRLNKGVANGANANDIGLFFERGTTGDDAIFYWDEGEDIFKLGTTTNDDHEATDFGGTTSFGTLKLATLTATSNSTVGGTLGITGLLNADGGIEIDNNGNKFTVSTDGAVVSVGGITDTTTASAFAENTTIGNLTLANNSITSGGGSISFGDENLSTSGDLAINTDKFTVAGDTGNTLVAGTLEVTLGATFTAGLSANDQNITNVADIALDSISADGDAIAIILDDQIDSALVIREGNNNYITVDTTDNAELITFEKDVQFNGNTNITANFDQAITINDSGAAVDFRVEGDNQTHLLFTDGSTDRVGVNTDTPLAQFHVNGDSKFVGAITQDSGSVVFNNGLGNFDFRVAGDNQANLLFVDASADSIGIGKNDPSKTLDITGNVGISSSLDVTGKTTLAGSLDLTTDSTDGITFRSEIAANGADAGENVNLLRVNIGANGGVAGNDPLYKSVLWNPDMDRFEVESGLKSTGNFTVGGDLATINATTGVTSIKGATTINNSGGTADLIVQNNGADVLNVDVSAGTTTITGQLKTDDLRAKTAGTDNFKVVLEDGIANALEIYDDSIANESYLLFNTQGEKMDFGKEVNFNSRANFTTSLSLQSGVSSGVKYNSNLENAVSADATLMTIEGGTNKSDVVLRWDTSEDEVNLNAEAILHLQGKAGDSALTIGGATGANANITMTTAGAITLAGTLDSPTINTDKITDKAGDGLVVELADALNGNALLVSDAGGANYLTVNTSTEKVTLHKGTTVSNTLAVSMQTTLGGILNLKYDENSPLIKANSDLTGNGEEADATLIEVVRGEAGNAKFKWDETSNSFEFDAILSAEGNFQVGTDAQNPKATINSTSGNLSTDGTISATSSITTDSVLNFTTASQGAIVFNSDLGGGANPDDADDFGLTVNRGAQADAKLYWDEGDNVWSIETGNVQITESLVVDSDANGKITISSGQIVSESGTISFDDENLTTTGSITSATPALNTNSTTVATTAFVKGQKLGDFDQVDTSGFDTTGQVLVWDQENSTFEVGTAVYNSENARDDVGAALAGGTHTGATTITFTNDDANDVINLALGITTEDLTDVSADQATNNQVLRFTTAEGDNQNKYVPTTLGTAADVDTGLDNGEIPTLTTHYHSTKTNETADLIITGRIIESINYGLVSEAFDENTDWEIDFGLVTETVISSIEDYGQLVV